MILSTVPPQPMSIALFTDRDYQFCYMADVASYEEPWEIGEYLHTGRTILLAMEHKPIGFIAWRLVKGNEGIIAVIDKLCVLPKYRYKGHGSKLLQTCLADTRRCRRVMVNAPLVCGAPVPCEVASWLHKHLFVASNPTRDDDGGYTWLTFTYHNLP